MKTPSSTSCCLQTAIVAIRKWDKFILIVYNVICLLNNSSSLCFYYFSKFKPRCFQVYPVHTIQDLTERPRYVAKCLVSGSSAARQHDGKVTFVMASRGQGYLLPLVWKKPTPFEANTHPVYQRGLQSLWWSLRSSATSYAQGMSKETNHCLYLIVIASNYYLTWFGWFDIIRKTIMKMLEVIYMKIKYSFLRQVHFFASPHPIL